MFVHFAPNTWQDREYDDRSTPLSAINPDIDSDQWAQVARDLGARYVVMVAKHVGGFCMWQTRTSDYGIRNTPWKGGRGDVMAELSASCRQAKLGLGVYLSPRDDTFGAGGGGKCATPEKQAAYNRIYRQQLTELLTRYGDLVEIWFDGSIVVPVCDIVRAHAPHAAIFQGPCASIRWVGNEDGFAPYPCWNTLPARAAATGEATAKDSDPDGDAWLPNEVDVSIRRPNWFWSTTNERNLLGLDQLLEIYYRSVGRGAQLLLNMPPDRTGHIPAADAARAKELGDEVRRRFGRPLAERSRAGRDVVLELPSPALVDHVVMEEDLAGGERVREYRLEGLAGGQWIPLGSGTAVGHKRIQPVPPLRLEALRLDVTRSVAPPRVRRLAAFATGAAPPPTWNDPGPR
jgi:alpha-L-fucosidase